MDFAPLAVISLRDVLNLFLEVPSGVCFHAVVKSLLIVGVVLTLVDRAQSNS